MNTKINVVLIFSVAFFPYFFQCMFASRDETRRKRLYDTVQHRPTAAELTKVTSDSDVLQEIQANILKQLFFIRQYPSGFIQLLNSQKTMSPNPIELSNDDISLLSSEYYHTLLDRRIVTQLKLYRKIQEIHCTNYVFLKYVLPNVKDGDLRGVSNFVEYMIDMSYKGKFIVSKWLWEFHIKLLELRRSKHFGQDIQTFLKTDLTDINDTLEKLITSCQQNNYLKDDFDNSDQNQLRIAYSKLEKRSKQYFKKNPDDRLLSIREIDNFFFKYTETIREEWFLVETGFVFDWQDTVVVLKREIENINDQHKSGKWTAQPFDSIRYHEIILNVVKVKLYSFVWLDLVVYKRTGVKAKQFHDQFIGKLARNDFLDFLYMNDPMFNALLISLSEICLPGDEKIDSLVQVLSIEVNRILRKVAGPNNPQFRETRIDEAFVSKKSESEDSKFLRYLAIDFENFVERSKEILNGLTLNVLLFYINGNKTVDFVFPNKNNEKDNKDNTNLSEGPRNFQRIHKSECTIQ